MISNSNHHKDVLSANAGINRNDRVRANRDIAVPTILNPRLNLRFITLILSNLGPGMVIQFNRLMKMTTWSQYLDQII